MSQVSFNELDYSADEAFVASEKKKKEEEEFLLNKEPRKKITFAGTISNIMNFFMKMFSFLKEFKFWANSGKDIITGEEIEHHQGKPADGIDSVISLQPGIGIESDLLPSTIKTSLRTQYKNILNRVKDSKEDATKLKINFVLGPLKQSLLSVVENEEDAISEINNTMKRINNVVKSNITNSLNDKKLTEAEKKFNKELLNRLTNLKYKKFVSNNGIEASQELLEENKSLLMQYSSYQTKQREILSKQKLEEVKRKLAIDKAKKDGIDLKADSEVVEDIKNDLLHLNFLISKAQNGEDVTHEIQILKEKAKLLIQRYLPEQSLDIDDLELGNLVNKVLNDKEACLKQYQSQVDEQTAKKIAEEEFRREIDNINVMKPLRM